MKLKKIASLMLAGIMAVSMLAGCGEGTNGEKPGDQNEDKTPSINNASTVLYDGLNKEAQNRLTVVSNPDLDKALADGVETFISDSYVMTYFRNGGVDKFGTGDDLYKSVANALDADVADLAFTDQNKDDETSVVIFVVGGGVSEKNALNTIIDRLDNGALSQTGAETNLPTFGKVGTPVPANNNYSYSYTVSASVVSKSVNAMATDMSATFVAVAVTKTATEL